MSVTTENPSAATAWTSRPCSPPSTPSRARTRSPSSSSARRNTWSDGTHSRSTFSGFYGAMQEMEHKHETEVDSDHPAVLVGQDNGPTPVEYLLHAIAACLTSGVANIAAARGVKLTKVTSTVEGDIDLLGILGLSDGSVRNGYEQIKVTFHIEGDADEETLRGIVEQSRQPLRRVRRAHQPHARRHRRGRRLSADHHPPEPAGPTADRPRSRGST